MTPLATDGISLAPTVNEGETTAEIGAVAAVGEGRKDPEDGVGEDPDEEVEDEGEMEPADRMEAALMEALAVRKPWEEDEPEEQGKKEELDGETKVAAPSEEEEPEEVEEGKEEGDCVAEEDGLVDGSAANETNEIFKQEHPKRDNTNKDKVANQLSNDNDTGGSRSADMQNFELAGDLEIFVDDLPKDCVEEDIAMIFSQSGEVKSVRIIKNSSTGKDKDIAFVCYASIEGARNALAEFKDGIEVKGRKVRVSACQDNNTLYLGNICKGWTKDQVLATLKSIGIQECKISFPIYKGGGRGFAFLKFASHYCAIAAFHRLMKPDAIFGIDRSAKISFYQSPKKPSNTLMQAKKVYLENVPLSWDEDRITECCKAYGNILKVDLFQISKNMEIETFSFVEFSSSKSALACVEGINKAKIVDGGFRVSACLAQPRSGLKVNSSAASKGATTSKNEKNDTEKTVVDKNSPCKLPKGNLSKRTSRTKEGIVKTNSPSKLPKGNVVESQPTYQGAAVLQTANTSKRKRKVGKNRITYTNQRPLKKALNNSNFGGSLRSKVYASDLEPHAGFIPPATRVHSTHAYDRQRTSWYDIHPIDVHPYARETAAPRPPYSDYRSHTGYEAGYTYSYPAPPPGWITQGVVHASPRTLHLIT